MIDDIIERFSGENVETLLYNISGSVKLCTREYLFINLQGKPYTEKGLQKLLFYILPIWFIWFLKKILKYDNLINNCDFEDIPMKFESTVSEIYTKANRYVPIQLNGVLGNLATKRDSKTIEMSSQIV